MEREGTECNGIMILFRFAFFLSISSRSVGVWYGTVVIGSKRLNGMEWRYLQYKMPDCLDCFVHVLHVVLVPRFSHPPRLPRPNEITSLQSLRFRFPRPT